MTEREKKRASDNVPTDSIRAEDLLAEIELLERGKTELWPTIWLLALVLLLGVFAFVLPNVMWNLGPIEVAEEYFPQIVFGFGVLLVLYNLYALTQRRELAGARAELLRQLLRADAAEKLSMTDPLTGAFNRRYLDRLLRAELKRSHRTGRPFSILMIDLDEFGAVNKLYGHLMGDRLLVQVAELLNEVFRQTDTIVRYGGDEFLVVLVDTDEESAASARSRLGAAVQARDEARPDSEVPISMSCGWATSTDYETVDALMSAADVLMRRRKAASKSG